jgi:hypothetical protein
MTKKIARPWTADLIIGFADLLAIVTYFFAVKAEETYAHAAFLLGAGRSGSGSCWGRHLDQINIIPPW